MRLLVPILVAALGLQAQAPRPSEVQERRLANGARLLLVERRGLTAFHAALVFSGGRAEEPAATAGATDLLARALYGITRTEDLEQGKGLAALESLLKQEEGLLEAIRLERLLLRRDAAAASQLPALEANLESVQSQLRALTATTPLGDLYLSRGGRQWAEASTDALSAHTELPQEAFEFWCRTEAQRLRSLTLSRFAQARASLAAELRTKGDKGPALLYGAALPGHPYGRDLTDHLPALEALRWSELRSYAHRALRPDRLTIILVGGLSLEAALPLVERHLGSLPVPPASETNVLPEIPADLGDRRVQAAAGESARLLMGWRIPARSHPDHLALRLATQLLGGGQSSRLPSRLQRQKGLVTQVSLGLDLPGGRLPGLLVADMEPAPGHSLAEVEGALQGEILRLQQDPIPQEEWQRALAQLESDHLRNQDDPEALAKTLGQAWAEGGDWRLAELDLQRLRGLAPEAVQAAARAWLKPTHRTTVLLEPTPGANLDPLDAELSQVLQALATTRIQDPAQREHLVAEGLRQLRMLNSEERRRTLKLLVAQLPPEKR
ncbi:pitrilysin family protein [Geothrix sp. PMB-07]|uniref:M16 family metallopeptidase n=1 Tax=Geothrix sp. PMB-07 TaxID=3068640 RepID=UPI00274069BA|nr:pitrilysin family protein [Geothrix sp. PMB-07]WLT31158.1 pitrilysin family protein [Geothrix sp. PMB-07]